MEEGPNLKLVIVTIILISAAFIGYLVFQPKEVSLQIESPAPPEASATPVSVPAASVVASDISPIAPSSARVEAPVFAPEQLISQVSVVPEGPAHTIIAEDFVFKPQNVTVAVGGTVDWMYGTAKYKHKVHIKANKEAETPGAQSPMLTGTGDHWNFTFSKPGLYEYVDVILPTARGWIVVK